MDVDGDASPVVVTTNGAVLHDRHDDSGAVTRKMFVHRVVDNLIDEVVKSALTGRSDVHAGPLANRLETLENLDVSRTVFFGRILRFRFRHVSSCRAPKAYLNTSLFYRGPAPKNR